MSSSKTFKARKTSGECGLCAQGICKDEQVLYLTARTTIAGLRPLTAEEQREVKSAVSSAFRRARRTGRRGRPALNISWLWEKLVHNGCAKDAGFGKEAARGKTAARAGTRTTGHLHTGDRPTLADAIAEIAAQ